MIPLTDFVFVVNPPKFRSLKFNIYPTHTDTSESYQFGRKGEVVTSSEYSVGSNGPLPYPRTTRPTSLIFLLP